MYMFLLEDRAKIANKKLQSSRDTIFISLHCNSTPTPEKSPHGYEVYYLAQSGVIENSRETSILSSQLIDIRRDPKVQYIQRECFHLSSREEASFKAIDSKVKRISCLKDCKSCEKKNNYQVLRGSMIFGSFN